ncbi:iron chelate uptake ABC transporter family permease subunit [Amycolatopsis acidiphila]|uniref:Iron chelate uptake ABC transporter family permease subunit n=1 Tax=Amycolatopsis acidiphila TaxID=715473 RepID=A0A558A3V6_9PSEU|nr:iron chelate uptake ABC transporter family permease subunit [Amycolatopsis acidiphila]TVT18928.1 iron chelate uptake ABC transporter family permease subunit [Amycolatopsis acidiphila]UIJ60630.1 iron chelate uptake ABC transporter family permease subunit [Amycolatopsis acidiphila]GHG81677.1 iron ABC transporter permease [Amycolatopsis acidiphila]
MRSRTTGLVFALVLLVVVSLLSIAVGARSIPLSTVVHLLFERDGSDASFVVWDLRIPRTLIGIAVGASLGVAGAVMQALTRNPLADPGLLGVNAGASAAAALSVSVLGLTDLRAFVWFAFAGAAIAGTVLYFIAGRGGASPVRLALAGTAVSAALTGLTQCLTLLNQQTLDQMRFWTVGSLQRADDATLVRVAPFLGAGLILALLLARPLNALALGDDAGTSLGAHLGRTRLLSLLAVTLLAGAATAAVGPLVFVGLAVPHMVRALTGPDQRWVLPYCAVLAPALLLAADVLGRVIARAEIDVGVVTALLGAPVFIWLVRRSKAARA